MRSGKPFENDVVGHYVYRVSWSQDGKELLFTRTNRRQNVMDFAACSPFTSACSPHGVTFLRCSMRRFCTSMGSRSGTTRTPTRAALLTEMSAALARNGVERAFILHGVTADGEPFAGEPEVDGAPLYVGAVIVGVGSLIALTLTPQAES